MLEEILSLLDDSFELYVGDMPKEGDDACSLYLMGGKKPNYYFGEKGSDIKNPRGKVVVRSMDYEKGITYIKKVREIIDGYSGVKGVSKILCIFCDEDIFLKGKDEKNRSYFELKFNALISR